MSKEIRKADALIEMVNAFDQNDKKRSYKISNVIQKNINNELKEQQHTNFIKLSRDEKKLFLSCVKKPNYTKSDVNSNVVVSLKDGFYEMVIDSNNKVIFRKKL